MKDLAELLMYFLCSYALTFILIDASILNTTSLPKALEQGVRSGYIPIRPILLKFRFFQQMFKCYFCTGFWTSSLSYTLYKGKWWNSIEEIRKGILYILASAVVVYVLDNKIRFWESLVPNAEE